MEANFNFKTKAREKREAQEEAIYKIFFKLKEQGASSGKITEFFMKEYGIFSQSTIYNRIRAYKKRQNIKIVKFNG